MKKKEKALRAIQVRPAVAVSFEEVERRATPEEVGRREPLMAVLGCVRGLVLEFDRAATYLEVWASDPALLAAPREAMIGRTIDEVLGATIGGPFTERVLRVHATGVAEHFEYPLELDGVRRWFVADIQRAVSAEGRATVLFHARDVTRQRETEDALVRSEERFRLAARATNDVLWDYDVATGTVTWSPSTQEVLGYDVSSTTLSWWTERVHPDDAPRVVDGFGERIAGDASSWSDAYRFRRSDGTYADLVDRALIVRDATGAARRAVGSMADVTQINRLQAELLQTDRLAALGLLAAGVGHEVNNPLTYVMGNLALAVELLSAPGQLGEDDRAVAVAALTEAQDGTVRIRDIVKALKMFSRGDAGEIGPVELEPALESAIAMASNEIQHCARLVRAFSCVPPIRGNASQLVQVFLNLLVNAAQAIEQGARAENEIRVTTGLDPQGRVSVTVSDTGHGISPEDRSRVFDPFFTMASSGTGTGLGLSICQRLVRRLGGELLVQSEPGRGTSFTVLLEVDRSTV